jgi:hypothetical protein
MARAKRRETTDAVDILHHRYYAGRPRRLVELEQARAEDHVAQKLKGSDPDGCNIKEAPPDTDAFEIRERNQGTVTEFLRFGIQSPSP